MGTIIGIVGGFFVGIIFWGFIAALIAIFTRGNG